MFFYSPVRRWYIRKVSVHLVKKDFPHDCSTSSLLLPTPRPPSLLSIPRAHISLLMPPSLSPIHQACHKDVTASAVVPEYLPPPSSYPIPWNHLQFIVLSQRLCFCHRFHGPVIERLLDGFQPKTSPFSIRHII